MKKSYLILIGFILAQLSALSFAENCPDPEKTSLQWGVIPLPWELNPFSPHPAQGEKNTRFVRANILVAGYSQGVLCTYKNSVGEFSIWWHVRTKLPSRNDFRWIETLGGFVCSHSIELCRFHV